MRMCNMVELQSYRKIWKRLWIEKAGSAWLGGYLSQTIPICALLLPKILHVIPLYPLDIVQSYDYNRIRTPACIPKLSWLMLVFSLAPVGSLVGEELQDQRTLAIAEDH
jgi:hypothetical protein